MRGDQFGDLGFGGIVDDDQMVQWTILSGQHLQRGAEQLEARRYFDVMKRLRALFPVEDAILAAQPSRAALREQSA